LTRGDMVLIGSILLVAVCLWAGFSFLPSPQLVNAVVRLNGQTVAEFSVTGNELDYKDIKVPRGTIRLEFGLGKIRVLPLRPQVCPEGICWRTGWISKPGQTIICMPNLMTVTLVSPAGGVDTVVR
jgi:hypothetical protein